MTTEQYYLKAKTTDEAIQIAMQYPDSFKYLAGGTDLLINKFQGTDETCCLIDITDIKELKQVSTHGKVLRIGALITLDDLKKHDAIVNFFPALLEAAHHAASPVLRKTATIGGNILCENRCSFFNQSEFWRESVGYCLKCEGDVCIATGGKKACFSRFVSDTAPVLISAKAQLEILDVDGIHTIPLESVYTGDGIHPRNLSKTALIQAILLPLDNRYRIIFKKLRPREAVDFSSLSTAVSKDRSGNIRIVLGGIDPKPVVVTGSIHDEMDSLIMQAVKKSRIIDNDYYSRTYRKEMIPVFLRQSFNELEL